MNSNSHPHRIPNPTPHGAARAGPWLLNVLQVYGFPGLSRRAPGPRRGLKRSPGPLILIALGLQILAANAQSSPPIVVNSTFDGQFAGDTNPGDGLCDYDAATPGEQSTLRAAIQEADARPGPDTIIFDPAVFATPTTIAMNWAPLANANGTTLTIDGGTNKVTITSSLVGVRQFALGNGTGPGGNLTLKNLSITNGGGILVSRFWTLTVNNALFADNIGQGAGIDNNGTLTVNNSTFSANLGELPGTTGNDGGAIRNGGTATVLNCFIVGNTGGRGGAIFNHPDGTISLGNSYVGHNPTAATRPVFGTVTSLGYNGFNEIPPDIIGDLTGNVTVGDLNQYYPLADNGGPTRTHALTPTSGLLDKGTGSFGPASDQRGFTRPLDDPAIPNAPGGDGSDIGPFEFVAHPPFDCAITRSGAGIVIDFSNTLAGRTYRLERNLTLTGAWQSIPGVRDLTASTSGPAQFIYPGGATLQRAFYRVRVLPAYLNDFRGGVGSATVRGAAVWASDAIKLTDENTGNQTSAIVFDGIEASPALNGFTARFNLSIGPANGTPADGVSFAVGNLGVGAWGEAGPGLPNSLTVGFDTYNNGPVNDNIGIHVWVNGTHLALNATNPYTNGATVPVEISYDITNGLTVRYNGALIFTDLAVPGFAFPAVGGKFGLGARTGDLSERAAVDDVVITPQ